MGEAAYKRRTRVEIPDGDGVQPVRRWRAAGRWLAGAARAAAAVIEEIRKIPTYTQQAEAIRQGLRRAHSNSRGRGGDPG
jgi:hypothetical protein